MSQSNRVGCGKRCIYSRKYVCNSIYRLGISTVCGMDEKLFRHGADIRRENMFHECEKCVLVSSARTGIFMH